MKPILFATGNSEKLQIAKNLCNSAGIVLEQLDIETDEIQSENVHEIIKDKAYRKFAVAGSDSAVVVSDDSWNIPGLNGFPGPYMKSVDYWFTSQNIVDLMSHVEDRSIYLQQLLAYYDGKELVVFQQDIPGTVLHEPRGSYGKPAQRVIALDSDNGLSISEVYEQGKESDPSRFKNRRDVWQDFIEWYQKEQV